MQRTAVSVLISGVVALFGVTSAVLGFIAAAKRLTRDDIYVSGRECVYPANPAGRLSIGAIILLVVAQIIASAAGGCCSCCRPPGGAAYSNSTSTRRRVVAGVVTSVLSWVAAVIAVSNYLVGAVSSAPMRRPVKFTGPDEVECDYLESALFVRAAVLSLVATALGIMSCVLLRLLVAPPPVVVLGERVVGMPQWPAQGYGQEASSDPKLAPAQGHQEHPQVHV